MCSFCNAPQPPPPYLLQPPAAVNVTLGRQLFVDGFLLDMARSTCVTRRFHAAAQHPASPILAPDRPWERLELNNSAVYRGYARPFSGGVWY